MSTWYHDGKPIDAAPIDDRAFQYGDGLFETIAIRAGTPRLWDFHMERLEFGCSRLNIEMPESAGLKDELMRALEESKEQPGYSVAKIIVSSGVGQRGYGRAPASPAAVFIGVFPARPVARDTYRRGVDMHLCETRLAVSSATAGIKTLNRLEQVIGRSEALAAGAFEGLMLDADGRVICGTMSNVFIVSDKSLKTPSLERNGVAGVMRRLMLESLDSSGMDIEVRDIDVDEFRTCDEVFLTNSQFGLLPVRECGQHEFEAGSVTRNCQALLADAGIAECAI